ncbi:MAG TPA: hypothetical protein VK251_12730, partial [Steroidobacteraceae bacterium]|nr:hypothetical protein [Steroidobacteraceae bacterium]
ESRSHDHRHAAGRKGLLATQDFDHPRNGLPPEHCSDADGEIDHADTLGGTQDLMRLKWHNRQQDRLVGNKQQEEDAEDRRSMLLWGVEERTLLSGSHGSPLWTTMQLVSNFSRHAIKNPVP